MCGINGFNFRDQNKLMSMNSCTTHRGPDFTGTFINNEVSLGHLLLSIREVSELSHQPYTREENTEWVLLFNGQIYNTSQLKTELENLDPKKTDLDTYILYKIIEKYGWKFIEKVHGMFSICLYNSKEGVMRLYRDPSGQKPLYYYFKNGNFIFSSEIKAILTHAVDREVDPLAIETAENLGYIPGEKTLFKHISKVAPSQYITFTLSDKKLEKAFYTSTADNYFPHDFGDAFHQLIEEHLQSKQRVALNLSGGLDSSILLHEMSLQGHDMHTYTTIFQKCSEKYNTDALLAKRLAHDYGSDHTEISITKESYKHHFIESYKIIEEPNFNVSLPAYLHMASAEGMGGGQNRVVLSGNGGDEIFGGYSHYYKSQVIGNWITLLTPWIFNAIKNYRNNTDFNFADIDERWFFFRRLQTDTDTERVERVLKYLKESIRPLISDYSQNTNDVYQTMLRERFLWMPGENFIQTDKIYMSQSAELRSPLAYHPFRVYADKNLTKKDYTDKSGNKIFLRKLYRGKLPAYITDRIDKTGWRAPINEWYDSSFKNLFLEILSDRNTRGLIPWNNIRKQVASSDAWPGKKIHLYLSLAILAREYNIDI